MTGLILGDVLPALREDAQDTATKLGEAYGRGIDWDNVPAADASAPPPVSSGINPREIEREYGPEAAYKPRMYEMTFRVPLGITQPMYERYRDEMLRKWIGAMDRRGFDLVSMGRIKVYPGINPARDLQTGRPIPGQREMIGRAYFTERHPEVVRVEIPGELLEDWQPSQLPTSDHAE